MNVGTRATLNMGLTITYFDDGVFLPVSYYGSVS